MLQVGDVPAAQAGIQMFAQGMGYVVLVVGMGQRAEIVAVSGSNPGQAAQGRTQMKTGIKGRDADECACGSVLRSILFTTLVEPEEQNAGVFARSKVPPPDRVPSPLAAAIDEVGARGKPRPEKTLRRPFRVEVAVEVEHLSFKHASTPFERSARTF